MKIEEMDKLTQHFNKYFLQSDCLVLHVGTMDPHIDALLYKPNEAYPYWKLVTMGAGDYRMPAPKMALGNRNEYMMFIDPEEDMLNTEIAKWYFDRLLHVARYPIFSKSFLSFGDSMEWYPEDDNDEMIGAYLELPLIVSDAGILCCKLGPRKTVICLQVILLNREEIDILKEIGSEQFSSFLYPPNNGVKHFICERSRSDKF